MNNNMGLCFLAKNWKLLRDNIPPEFFSTGIESTGNFRLKYKNTISQKIGKSFFTFWSYNSIFEADFFMGSKMSYDPP